ncbi:MAG: hypothetical protein WBC33_03500, partial [Conexibacter sp.]
LAQLARLLAPGSVPTGVPIPRLMPEAVAGALFEIVRARLAGGHAAQLPALLPDLLYCTLAPFLGPAEAAAIAAQ